MTDPTPLTVDDLDDLTIRLIFALRDSLTDVSPLDFWQGRAATALATARRSANRQSHCHTGRCLAACRLRTRRPRQGRACMRACPRGAGSTCT